MLHERLYAMLILERVFLPRGRWQPANHFTHTLSIRINKPVEITEKQKQPP